MRDQLNLIGIGFADTMKKAFPRSKEETSQKDGAKIITDLFQRRNAIATRMIEVMPRLSKMT